MWDTRADSCSFAEVGYDLLMLTGAEVLMLNIAGQHRMVPFTCEIAVLPSAETSTAGRGCCAHLC